MTPYMFTSANNSWTRTFEHVVTILVVFSMNQQQVCKYFRIASGYGTFSYFLILTISV